MNETCIIKKDWFFFYKRILDIMYTFHRPYSSNRIYSKNIALANETIQKHEACKKYKICIRIYILYTHMHHQRMNINIYYSYKEKILMSHTFIILHYNIINYMKIMFSFFSNFVAKLSNAISILRNGCKKVIEGLFTSKLIVS